MVHKLAIIAVIGLSASAVCMGAAAAIGGKEFGKNFDNLDLSFDERPRCENGGGYPTSRTLDWDGSDHVGLAVKGHATYTPGGDDKVHVSGNPLLVPHVRVRDGKVELDCRSSRGDSSDLAITLPGRNFRKFAILGGGNLALNQLDQDSAKIEIDGAGDVKAGGRIGELKMTINGSGQADFDQLQSRKAEAEIHGSGSISAKGKVDDVKIRIAGSGSADFGQMETRNADVKISGHGDAHIAPSQDAKVEIQGSGDVYLHGNPKTLDTDMQGSGRIHNVPAGG
ncbi:MAG: DUF2807 domain-containing protein [Alphaproteobacteria bacterium]|nr:DUF2807 domain-containing protein [Alphaproteobacteria bacterium]